MRCYRAAGLGLLAAAFASAAHAGSVEPTFDRFGFLDANEFGGDGIPQDAVAVTEINTDAGLITLGLTAHQRFANPPLANDGAGTFTALPGSNFGDPTGATTPSSTLGATWNFAFFFSVPDGSSIADYTFELLYDFDPAVDTDESALGTLNFNVALEAQTPGSTSVLAEVAGSQNPLFSFLSNAAVPGITPPSIGSFDPNAAGEYSFALRVLDGGSELGRSAINVNVVPTPAAAGAGLALLGALGAARTRRSAGRE